MRPAPPSILRPLHGDGLHPDTAAAPKCHHCRARTARPGPTTESSHAGNNVEHKKRMGQKLGPPDEGLRHQPADRPGEPTVRSHEPPRPQIQPHPGGPTGPDLARSPTHFNEYPSPDSAHRAPNAHRAKRALRSLRKPNPENQPHPTDLDAPLHDETGLRAAMGRVRRGAHPGSLADREREKTSCFESVSLVWLRAC